ncbi:MAG: acyltransferase family protein, partial [Actinomycetes bacterium]
MDASVAGTPPDRSHRRNDVQGLRALAVLSVVAFHVAGSPVGGNRAASAVTNFLPAGFIGVDVFFVISGFVITSMLLRERARTGRTSFRDFYERRARRLLPALAVMSVVVLIVSVLVLSPFGPQQFAVRTAQSASVFVANVYLYRHTGYFDSTAGSNPFLHTWSLSVEEQVYLLLPVGLAVAAWFGRRSHRRSGSDSSTAAMLLAVVVVSALSFALMTALWAGWRPGGVEAPVRLAFLGSPARLWEFGVGAVVALGPRWWAGTRRSVAEALSAIGFVAVIAVMFLVDPGSPYPGPVTVLPVLGTAAMLIGGTQPTLVARCMSVRPAVWLGDRSYSWYLWHWPCIVFAAVIWPTSAVAPLMAGVLSLGPAWAAHRWIEQPVRVDASVTGWRAVRVVGWCIGGVLVIGSLVNVGASRGWGLVEPNGWYDLPNGRNVGCHVFNRDSDATFPGPPCTTSPPGEARGTWLIVGDQSADSAAPAVVDVAHRRGFRTVQWTRSGCPFISRVPVHADDCAEWQRRVWQLVADQRPTLVVLVADSPAYTTDARAEEGIARRDGRHTSGVEESIDEWTSGVAATVRRLRSQGVSVLVVGPVPTFSGEFPRDQLSLLRPRPSLPAPTRAVAERRRTRVWAAATRRLRSFPSNAVAVVDPFDVLCAQAGRCPVWVGGVWRYYDDRHLTVAGSLL